VEKKTFILGTLEIKKKHGFENFHMDSKKFYMDQLQLESVSTRKLSRGRDLLQLESVSTRKLSRGRDQLQLESVSTRKLSRGRDLLQLESVSTRKLSRGRDRLQLECRNMDSKKNIYLIELLPQ